VRWTRSTSEKRRQKTVDLPLRDAPLSSNFESS
jgi:hypothetical protein